MGPWRCFGSGMWVFPLIMLGLLAIIAFIVIKRYGGIQNALNAILTKLPMQGSVGDASVEQTETALDILKKRYASGEITQEQFEDMKQNL